MSHTHAALVALAESRVGMAAKIIARQERHVASLRLSRLPLAQDVMILRLFEDNLAIFERHLALVRET